MAEESPYLWWKNEVIYQNYPRSFQDSNTTGLAILKVWSNKWISSPLL
jgi:hypothetical protein